MKPEGRRARWQVVEAEAAVVRQRRIIVELRNQGRTTKGAKILLALLEEATRNADEALNTLKRRF